MTPSFVCSVPWQHLEVGVDNNAYLCCHIPTPIGNLQDTDPEEIWNSPQALQIRQSILNRTYDYCRRSTCSFFHQKINLNNSDWWRLSLIVKPEIHNSPRSLHPLRVSLANERTCNLKCLSCRTSHTNDTQNSQAPRVWDRLQPTIAKASIIKANGSGEFWLSPPLRAFVGWQLRQHADLRLEILTNATVLDANEYLTSEFAGRASLIHVSVDAATREVYDIVRGGNFRRVMTNLESLANLHTNKKDPNSMVMSFVVSAANFHEMPGFAALAETLKIPASFTRIQDWGHLGAQFASLDVASPHHPQHVRLRTILKDLKDRCPAIWLNELVSLTI